jgi:hypothetical protein
MSAKDDARQGIKELNQLIGRWVPVNTLDCELPLITQFNVNDDGSVDVTGKVVIPSVVNRLPVRFRNVFGDFSWKHSRADSLFGSPTYVDGNYTVQSACLRSMEHAPSVVVGSVNCSGNFDSLQYCPTRVGGNAVIESYGSVDDVDCVPEYVGQSLVILTPNRLSLRNIIRVAENAEITSIVLSTCSHVLGLAMLQNVKTITFREHSANDVRVAHMLDVIHDLFQWQEKLLDLGLIDQAQL